MAPLRKSDLIAKVISALREAGAAFKRISGRSSHPTYIELYSATVLPLRVYIWNITHGGRLRPDDEYRVQITGQTELADDENHLTLVLGWRDEAGVFAGWDIRRHSGSVSSSPSMQVKEESLLEASVRGISLCHRGGGEVTVAFRPDMIVAYIENIDGLHGVPDAPVVVEEVNELVREAAEEEAPLPPEPEAPTPRERTESLVSRAVRDVSFRRRVLDAYRQRCAACGVQLGLVEAAHIVPVRHDKSTDETSNGLSLCSLHHKAFDTFLVTIGPDYRIGVADKRVEELKAVRANGGLNGFRRQLRDFLVLPTQKSLRPKPDYLMIRSEIATAALA